MKQHITVEQVWELSKHVETDGEPEWDSIVDFNTFMGYEWNLTEEESQKYTFQDCCEDTAKWTTIGKMIEILHREEWTVEIIQHSSIAEVSIVRGLEVHIFSEKELCDVLWDAIKKILH